MKTRCRQEGSEATRHKGRTWIACAAVAATVIAAAVFGQAGVAGWFVQDFESVPLGRYKSLDYPADAMDINLASTSGFHIAQGPGGVFRTRALAVPLKSPLVMTPSQAVRGVVMDLWTRCEAPRPEIVCYDAEDAELFALRGSTACNRWTRWSAGNALWETPLIDHCEASGGGLIDNLIVEP